MSAVSPLCTSADTSTLAYGVSYDRLRGGDPGAAWTARSWPPCWPLLAGRGVAAGPGRHLVGLGHRVRVAEQSRVDQPGQVRARMRLPGSEQGRQPAAGREAGGQVVAGQRGADLMVRLVDERPDPGDVQRAGQAGRLRPGPEREQCLVHAEHVAVGVAELGGDRIDAELGQAHVVDLERGAPLDGLAGPQASLAGRRDRRPRPGSPRCPGSRTRPSRPGSGTGSRSSRAGRPGRAWPGRCRC